MKNDCLLTSQISMSINIVKTKKLNTIKTNKVNTKTKFR